MARRKTSNEAPAGAAPWMTTYSDLVTLLLCFFVMLFASSNLDVDKFQSIADSFRGSKMNILPAAMAENSIRITSMLGNGIMQMPVGDTSARDIREEYLEAQRELSQMASNFETYFAENNLTGQVNVDLTSTYVHLTFSDGILFDKGSAELKSTAIEVLEMVADEIKDNLNNEIAIEGHTDSDPINTYLYRDNWDLSSARANAVGRYFISQKGFDPKRISSQGFGEYRPIAENDTEENKTKNRRVEIKIMSSTLSGGN